MNDVALSVDPDDMRARLGAAIEEHRQLIAELGAQPSEFPATAVGEGFAHSAGSLSSAMTDIHSLTISFLENRVEAWEQILSLVDAVEAHDTSNAAEFGGRGTR
ncbi:hypothetical protein [Corynebacterium sp.]|uniref:hypothetical protein n=1 Tax=Corynebacterium sp. TaxID=1720 RepID=UPI002A90CF74|nr:hypothetical protein [Corynebacterium sp.]MDY5785879.1 hypothetical protein [Corynebacterium sp.]